MSAYPKQPPPKRQTGVIERVAAYLDGFNIYNGMMAKGWGRYRWLDYPALVSRYMRGSQQIVGIKYFTSLMMHQPDRYARQKLYVQALEVRGDVEIIRGEFISQKLQCRKCNKTFKIPREKRTDVNLATHLVADAFDNRFDTFIVCTADSDLLPAVSYVQARFGKRFILIDPPRRHSDELATIANQHLHSRKHYFGQSQLPDPVEYTTRRGRVKRIHRPASWLTAQVAESVSAPDDDGVVHCLSCGQTVSVERAQRGQTRTRASS